MPVPIFYYNPTYLWLVLFIMLISGGVQLYLQSTVRKWSGVQNAAGLTGMQVAQALFQRTSLNAIQLQRVPGVLSDHFDPGANVVRLSDGVANQPSVAAMAIAAHELGHVQQYQTKSALIAMRGFLLPALQFSPTISYFAILIGLLFNMVNLIWIGILFFGLMVLFSILTLPVELDASRRALVLLQEAKITQSDQELAGARSVLFAAALTYLAAAVTSVLQLLYYISLAQRRS